MRNPMTSRLLRRFRADEMKTLKVSTAIGSKTTGVSAHVHSFREEVTLPSHVPCPARAASMIQPRNNLITATSQRNDFKLTVSKYVRKYNTLLNKNIRRGCMSCTWLKRLILWDHLVDSRVVYVRVRCLAYLPGFFCKQNLSLRASTTWEGHRSKHNSNSDRLIV